LGLIWAISNVFDTIYQLFEAFFHFLTVSIDFWHFFLAFRLLKIGPKKAKMSLTIGKKFQLIEKDFNN
jgi:hypothetical protein